MKLTEERKKYIDNLSYQCLLERVRFAPIGDSWFQGETGNYWLKRMAELRNKPNGDVIHTQASKNIGWS